jgi:hypothetical protein
MGCSSSVAASPTKGKISPVGVASGSEGIDKVKNRNKSITETNIEARAKFQRKKNVRVRVDDGVIDFAAIPDVPKSEEDMKFLSEALAHQWLFQSMDTESLEMVISKMTKREYNKEDEIVTQVSK